MSRMGAEERSIVLYLTRQQAEQAREASGDTPEDEWLLSRAQRAVRRGASSMGFGLWQGIGHMAVGLQKAAGDMLGGELGREQLEYAAERDLRLQVLHDIKNMAQQEVYPLLPEDSTLAERMFIDAAQATPAANIAPRYPIRRSPPQTAKASHSQAQPKAPRKARSLRAVNRGRRGRRNT
jgi:hypothetical protein